MDFDTLANLLLVGLTVLSPAAARYVANMFGAVAREVVRDELRPIKRRLARLEDATNTDPPPEESGEVIELETGTK